MDDKMLKAGGEAKRKELVTQFDDLSLAEKGKMTEEEAKIAKYGDTGQAEALNAQKRR